MKPLKPKKCVECGKDFLPSRTTQKVCSPQCAILDSQKKAQKKKAKDWKAEKKVLKEKVKTLADWKAELQTEINKIVRLIDFKVPCISSGATAGQAQSGHYISRGSNDTIRFNLHNIFLQSAAANNHKSGDTINFQEGLKRIYGLEYFEYVESLRKTPPIKLTIETIKDKIIIARLIVRELKELGNVYSPKERIDLRNNLNLRLGIYLE